MEAMPQAIVTAAVTEAIRLGAIGFDAVKLIALARLERRPARLDLAAYPHLPRPTVRTTSAADYATLVSRVRNALSYVGRAQQSMVSAALRQAFIQPDRATASQTMRHTADQLRGKWPKLAAFIDESETDVLAHMDFPGQHRSKIHSTNPIERVNKEVKRRADVVGIFPNEAAIVRLAGAVLLELNDEWQLQHRYMQTEAMAELTPALVEVFPPQIATAAE